MQPKLTEHQQKMFNEILAATHDGRGAYYRPMMVFSLTNQGLVAATGKADGAEKEFRATDAGIAYASKSNGKDNNMSAVHTLDVPQQPKQAKRQAAPKPVFEIESGVPLPEKAKRVGHTGGGRGELYPFGALEVSQSFFVPPTDKHPEPWKSLGGTVSQAMRRYAEPIEGQTRKARNGQLVQAERRTRVFRLLHDTKNGIEGARIFRVA